MRGSGISLAYCWLTDQMADVACSNGRVSIPVRFASLCIFHSDLFRPRLGPTPSQLTHNVFITLLESCAELFWDKRCSNLVATFDQLYFVWQWKWVISNVVTTLQQRYLATYNVAATLFGKICPTFAQSFHSTLWQRSRNFPGLRFHNFHSMLWKRCYNLKLLAGVLVTRTT